MRSKFIPSKFAYAIVAGLVMFVASFLVESAVMRWGTHVQATLLDEVLLGGLAALGGYVLMSHRESRRDLLRRQASAVIISDLNHHIRNAMQIIVNQSELTLHGMPEVRDIQNAVDRIDWALREILPRVDRAPSSEPESSGTPTAPVHRA